MLFAFVDQPESAWQTSFILYGFNYECRDMKESLTASSLIGSLSADSLAEIHRILIVMVIV